MPSQLTASKEQGVKLLKLKTKEGESPRIHLRIPEELLKKINKEIKETRTDCSHVVRNALWDYFERRKEA